MHHESVYLPSAHHLIARSSMEWKTKCQNPQLLALLFLLVLIFGIATGNRTALVPDSSAISSDAILLTDTVV
jgi:hypothetical protein